MSKDARTQARIKTLQSNIDALKQERDRLRRRDRNFQALYDRLNDRLRSEHPMIDAPSGVFQGLSFVVVYYDIPRQIERTLQTLSPAYQQMPEDQLEVILIDNGSPEPLPEGLQDRHPHVSRIVRIDDKPSPVFALNEGARLARYDMVAMMIDGAHMLTPGVAQAARDIWSLYPNPVINVPQYMLGRESQALTHKGDAFERETRELAEAGWPEDGYALFHNAVFPGENFHRSYVEAIETNCLITTRRVLDTFGGFDERYDEPGGGFSNLEIFTRLIHQPENSYITLPGEGTFHQDHRGVTTQRAPEERNVLVSAYRKTHQEVTGSEAVINVRSPILFGKARRITQRVPTISLEYSKTSNRIQKQLANLYVGRLQAGITDPFKPELTTGIVPDERRVRMALPAKGLLPDAVKRNGVKERDMGYLKCLRDMHELVQPNLYFEIGVDMGASLALAKCPCVGVDPSYTISNPVNAPARLFRETSDAFFANTDRCNEVLDGGIDLAFIDGMHLAEYVLRDFIETEKWMSPEGVIMFDDVLPEQMEMLNRERHYNAWTGDVFKIVPILRRYRPDLQISVFETFVGPYRKGLAVVSRLDPQNQTLEAQYKRIETEICDTGEFDVSSIEELDQIMAVEPLTALPDRVALRIRSNLAASRHNAAVEDTYRGTAVPNAPKLSVVIIAHDMARELPRSLYSLSDQMQTGMSPDDFEIIVVDNGSAKPADKIACAKIARNTRFIDLPASNPSPCHAINRGIAAARAPLVGVMIDGARMASPGLLRSALLTLEASPNAVVGCHGFHLGDAVQSEAMKSGYNQDVEDRLLDAAGWEEDGYRLFDISVFSKSSAKRWKTLPSESNAVFMNREAWDALNGYDEGFRQPGGGLANLDLWKRACERPGSEVVLLLGEGTFHQIHGGASSNATTSPRADYDTEYEALRGTPFKRPKTAPRFVGTERDLLQETPPA